MNSEADIASEILRQCTARAPDRTICPSEVARALWPGEWRTHMSEVRTVGLALASIEKILITQDGETRAPNNSIRGPIRYKLVL